MILARCGDLSAAATALAAQVAQAVEEGLRARDAASLVLPGGRTPLPLFERLRDAPLDWSRVSLTLTDERWVAEGDAASNAALVRRAFSVGAARAATFVPLHDGAPNAAAALDAAWQRVQKLAFPFDAVVLGMGEDGHFASLFPGNEALPVALDPGESPACVAMQAPVQPVDRISLNLAALLHTRRLFLLITGQAKLDLLTHARDGDAHTLPIAALLAQRQPLLEVFWSP